MLTFIFTSIVILSWNSYFGKNSEIEDNQDPNIVSISRKRKCTERGLGLATDIIIIMFQIEMKPLFLESKLYHLDENKSV